jgi:hypothetical protein
MRARTRSSRFTLLSRVKFRISRHRSASMSISFRMSADVRSSPDRSAESLTPVVVVTEDLSRPCGRGQTTESLE